MLIAVLIALAIIIIGGILGATFWLTSRLRRSAPIQEIAKEAATGKGPAFRWSYIGLPLVLLLLSIILSLFFYQRLPAEVATHFELDGTPDRWLSRGMTMVWMLAPQLLLILVAIGATWGITRISHLFKTTTATPIKPEQILIFMGNAFALPQLVLFLVMLDIFSYNSYQRHVIPLGAVIFITVGLATVVLGILLALLISKARQQPTARPDQTKEQ